MKQNTYRVTKSILIAIVAGGCGIYSTVHRNSVDYQVHPAASLLGSVVPGIVFGIASYGWDIWRARSRESEPFPYAKACFVLLIFVLLIQIIFGAAILTAMSDVRTINGYVRTNAVATGGNFRIDPATGGSEFDGRKTSLSYFEQALRAEKDAAAGTVNKAKEENPQVIANLNVSDISLFSEPDMPNGTNYVRLTNLQGRIKNGSSKTITGVALKLCIFDSSTNEAGLSTNQIDTISVDVVGGWTIFGPDGNEGKSSFMPAFGQPSQLDPNEVKPFKADVPQTFATRIPVGFRYSCSVDGDKVHFKP